jgi:hypothetical protein
MISTTTSMTTNQLAEAANPLTELPLVGGVVEVVHSLLTDLGIPLWMAESIELAGLLLVTYLALRLVLVRLLPWFARAVDPVVDRLFDLVAMVLLAPELAVTRTRLKMGKAPFGAAYVYGDGVVTATRAATSLTRAFVNALPKLGRAPKVVPLAIAVLLALMWNSTTCASTGPTGMCVSPAAHWISVTEQWFTANS